VREIAPSVPGRERWGHIGRPSLTFGASLLLPAFAAVVLGSTQLLPGRFNVSGTLLSIFVLATGVQGLLLVSDVQWISDMFNGVALIVAVSMAASRIGKGPKRTRRTRRTPSGPREGAHPGRASEPTDAGAHIAATSTS
jgi:ribose transport system permease protein